MHETSEKKKKKNLLACDDSTQISLVVVVVVVVFNLDFKYQRDESEDMEGRKLLFDALIVGSFFRLFLAKFQRGTRLQAAKRESHTKGLVLQTHLLVTSGRAEPSRLLVYIMTTEDFDNVQ